MKATQRELLHEIIDFIDSRMLYDDLLTHLSEHFELTENQIESYLERLI